MAATIRSIIGGDVPSFFGSRDGLASIAEKTFQDDLEALPIHLQLSADEVEIYGGFLNPQLINTIAFEDDTLDWLLRELSRLDQVIDIDFYFQADSDGTLLDVYLDSEIQLDDGTALGLATPNYLRSSSYPFTEYRWWEVFLNTPELISNPNQLRYALIHEIGHALGLEHPFEDNDGDVWGTIFSWPRGDETVMSYTKPDGDWPIVFSPLDFAALASLWSLESDHDAGWYFRNPDGSQVGPLTTVSAHARLAEERLNEQLIGPASPPAQPLVNFAPVNASLLLADPDSAPPLLLSQGADLVYFGFSDAAHSDPQFVDQARSTLGYLDDLIELDFVELSSLDSPLLQLVLSRGSSSDYASGDGLLWLQRDLEDRKSVHSSALDKPIHTLTIDTINPYYQHLDLFESRDDYLNYALLHGLALSLGLVYPWSDIAATPEDFSVRDTVLALYASDVIGDSPLSALDRALLLDQYGAESRRLADANLASTPQLSLEPGLIRLDEAGNIIAAQTFVQRSVNSAPDVAVELLRLPAPGDNTNSFVRTVTKDLPSGSNTSVLIDNLPQPVSSLRYRLANPVQASLSDTDSELELTAPNLWAGLDDSVFTLRSPGKAISLEAVLPRATSSNGPPIFSVHYNAQAFSPSIPSNLASSAKVVPDLDDLDLDPHTSHRLVINRPELKASSGLETIPPDSISFVATSARFDPLTGREPESPLRISYEDPSTLRRFAFSGVQLSTFHLDVDGDGRATALGDGLMIVRKLFSSAFSGDALIDGAISHSATRNATEISNFIQHGVTTKELDVDGDGVVTALGDGLMIVRLLFSSAFRSPALIEDAISPSSPLLGSGDLADRQSAAQLIGAAIDELTPLNS